MVIKMATILVTIWRQNGDKMAKKMAIKTAKKLRQYGDKMA